MYTPEKKMINGVLHYNQWQFGKWIPYSASELTALHKTAVDANTKNSIALDRLSGAFNSTNDKLNYAEEENQTISADLEASRADVAELTAEVAELTAELSVARMGLEVSYPMVLKYAPRPVVENFMLILH